MTKPDATDAAAALQSHWPAASAAVSALTRKLNGVSAEMSLNVLVYNLKLVMKIIGTEGLLKAMAA